MIKEREAVTITVEKGLLWYALYTKPRAERQVYQVLASRQIEVYLPTIKVWRVRRQQLEDEPLFRCYLFARLDFQDVGYSSVAWIPGLRYIVGSEGDTPIPVPDQMIAYIRRRVDQLDPREVASNLKQGDSVRITEGPFKDMDAIFDRHLSGYERAQVLIEVLGRLTAYDVFTAWLEPDD